MFRLLVTILFISVVGGDCWKPIAINAERPYIIRDEGKPFKPLYSENEERISSGLVIDGDMSNRIKMGYSFPFPMADTVRIDLFDNDISYAHSFNIIILKNQYAIRYSREIVGTDLLQIFETVRSELELNTLDFSNGSKIRGHAQYIGKCVSGCSDKNKRIRIEGNFAVSMHRY